MDGISTTLLALREHLRLRHTRSFMGMNLRSAVGADIDHPLEAKLNALRRRLRHAGGVGGGGSGCKQSGASSSANANMLSADATECVVPFVEILNNESLGGLVKHAALKALGRLFQRTIGRGSPRIGPAVNAVADASIHLRMAMSSSEHNELVLGSVLDLICVLLRRCGELLTDEILWDVSNCIFRLHERRHATALFRHHAEEALLVLFESVFGRFTSFVVGEHVASSVPADALRRHDAPIDSTIPPVAALEFRPHGIPAALKLFHFAISLVNPEQHDALHTAIGLNHRNRKGMQTAALQTLGMKLVNTMLCAAGPSLTNLPATRAMVLDDLCRNIIRVSMTADTLLVCSALEAFQHLLTHCRHHLKPQVAMIFKYVYLKQLAEQTKNPGNVRLRMILESLSDLSAMDWFWVELYANYDCDPRSPSLLEPLCALLSKCAFPVYNSLAKAHELHVMQLTAVQCLLNGMSLLVGNSSIEVTAAVMAIEPELVSAPVATHNDSKKTPAISDLAHERAKDVKAVAAALLARNVNRSATITSTTAGTTSSDATCTTNDATARSLRALRVYKLQLEKAVALFNAKPKHGVRELERIGILPKSDQLGVSTEQRAVVIADFLRNSAGLDKARIGELLGGGETETAQAIRQCYVDTFNVAGQSTVSSLRMFLGAFRLPGEAQQIDRILQTFAKSVFECSSDRELFATADVAYLLSFSIIMLNTDLHNPNIKPERKMTLSQFVATNKDYGNDVSQGKVLPLDFLVSIYNSIKSSEFETHKGTPGGGVGDGVVAVNAATTTAGSRWSTVISDDAWRDMLLRAKADSVGQRGEEVHYYTRSDDTLALSSSTMASISGGVEQCCPDVFKLVHRAVSSAMTVVLETAHKHGSTGIEDALEGFLLLSRGAVMFDIPELLDQVLVTLNQSMGLPVVASPLPKALSSPRSGSTRAPTKGEDGAIASATAAAPSSPPSLASSPSSVRPKLLPVSLRPEALLSFGCNHKAHMSCMAFFGIFRQFSSTIGVAGWDAMLRVLLGLWQIGMLPRSMIVPQPMRGSSDAHFHFLAVTKAARSQAQSEFGLQRSTSSGLFSWLFAAEEEDADRSEHSGLVFGEEGILSLSQRLDRGPMTLEELDTCAKERTATISAAAKSAMAGTQPRTKKHRQDVQSLSTAIRCVTACQLAPGLLTSPRGVALTGVPGHASNNEEAATSASSDKTKDSEFASIEKLVSTTVFFFDSFSRISPGENRGGRSVNGGVSTVLHGDMVMVGGLPLGDSELSRHNVRAFLLHTAASILISQDMENPQCLPSLEVLIERMLSVVCDAKLPSFAVEVTATSLLKLLRVMIKHKNTASLAFRALRLLCPYSPHTDQNQTMSRAGAGTATVGSPGVSTPTKNSRSRPFSLSHVVADALAVYLGFFLHEILADQASLLRSSRAWNCVFDILSALSKHRLGAPQGFRCACFIMRSDAMTQKVPLSVAATLVDYVLSPHASEDVAAIGTTAATAVIDAAADATPSDDNSSNKNDPGTEHIKESKDARFSAIEAMNLLFELHRRSLALIQKYSALKLVNVVDNVSVGNAVPAAAPPVIDCWADCWRPILVAIARCFDSKYASVRQHASMLIAKAFCDEHKEHLTPEQMAKSFDEVLLPLVTTQQGESMLLLAASTLRECSSRFSSGVFAKIFVKVVRSAADVVEGGECGPLFVKLFYDFELDETLTTLADATLGGGGTPKAAKEWAQMCEARQVKEEGQNSPNLNQEVEQEAL